MVTGIGIPEPARWSSHPDAVPASDEMRLPFSLSRVDPIPMACWWRCGPMSDDYHVLAGCGTVEYEDEGTATVWLEPPGWPLEAVVKRDDFIVHRCQNGEVLINVRW